MKTPYVELRINSMVLTAIGEVLTEEELVILSTRVSDQDQHTQSWIANQVECHRIRKQETGGK